MEGDIMNKQKQTVPPLRFPEFSGEWVEKKLGEIATNGMYGMNAAAKKFDGENKYIRITDISEQDNKFTPSPLCSPDGILEDKYLLQENDLLFARTGASTGKTYLYNKCDGRIYFAGFLIKFNVLLTSSSTFVFYQTLRQAFFKWVKIMSMRSGQPGINAEEYREFRFLMPQYTEQAKIAEFLSVVDERLALLNEKHKTLEQYKKGVMQKLFSQQLRFKDQNGNNFPDWEEKKLGEIAIKSKLKNTDNTIKTVFSNSATLGIVLQESYFEREIVNENNLFGYYVADVNSFVYNPRLSSHAPVGAMSVNKLGVKGIVSPLYTVFNLNKEVIVDFLMKYFKSTVWHHYMRSVANYGARDDRMNIKDNDLFLMPITLPCLAEQEKIANFLSSIDDKITAMKAQINTLEQYKKALLLQMFV